MHFGYSSQMLPWQNFDETCRLRDLEGGLTYIRPIDKKHHPRRIRLFFFACHVTATVRVLKLENWEMSWLRRNVMFFFFFLSTLNQGDHHGTAINKCAQKGALLCHIAETQNACPRRFGPKSQEHAGP